ncbi:MAG: GNAT family N-acetyltransferase [Bacteroidetes bacterium]|nr:GNAT family N-acetyltransferase [Bacteroidota bacterium]
MRFHLATLDNFATWHHFREELYDDLDPAYSEAEIHRIANDPNMATYLVFEEVGNAPVGMLELSLRNIVDGCASSPVAYIDGLYVVENWQGRGIGPQLVAFARQWALGQGCTELAVDTELDNKRAQLFYRKNGFEETFRIVQFRMGL